jgi:hypothetical protein
MEGAMKKEILNTKETPAHDIKIVKIDGIIIETLRSKKAPNGDFLPANATDLAGKRLWNFKDENFDGFGKLVEFQGEYFIYLEDRQRVIHRVIPVNDLPKIQRVKLGDKVLTMGGRDTLVLYDLKVAIADFLCNNFFVTEEEEALLAQMAKIRQVELEKERLRKEEERKAKEQAKVQKIAIIMSREKITVYTEDDKKRFGIPVVDGEWEMLSDNTAVVLVNNLEEKVPIEAFFVKKSASGRISKGSPMKVFPEKKISTKKEASPIIEARRIIRVIVDDKIQQILNFSKENFDRLRATGLNSGTLVSVGEPKDGKYTIVQLKGNECLTVGEFTPL